MREFGKVTAALKCLRTVCVEIIAIRLRESFRRFLDGDGAGSQDWTPSNAQESQCENRGIP